MHPRPTPNRAALILALLAVFAAGDPVHAAPPGTIRLAADADEHDFSDLARVALPAAIRTAQQKAPGAVIWAGYENMDGFLFAYVQIAGRKKSVTTVTVDAGNGRAVDVATRTSAQVAEDARKEQAEDAEKAKDPNSEEARKAKAAAANPEHAQPRYRSSLTVAPDATGAEQAARAKITIQRAITEASHGHPGSVTSAGVVADHGSLYFAITIKAAGGALTLYAIDAGNGKLLGNEAGG